MLPFWGSVVVVVVIVVAVITDKLFFLLCTISWTLDDQRSKFIVLSIATFIPFYLLCNKHC